MVAIVHSTARQIIPPVDSLFDLGVELIDTVTTAGASSQVTIGDAIFTRTTPSTIRKDAQLLAPPGAVFSSLDATKATVNAAGYVQSVGSGSVGLLARFRSEIRRYDFTAGTAGGQTVDTFHSYVADSLGEQINNEVDALVAAGGQLAIYSAADDTASTYTRNASCWLADIDLTCIPAWNSRGGAERNGIAITNRHLLQAKHFAIGIGKTVRFVTAGNVVVERTISAVNNIGTFDLQVATLSSDLPGTITPAKVLPNNWADTLTIGKIPIICSDQERKVVVRDTTGYSSSGKRISHANSTATARLPFTETIVVGDSGSMVGTIIDGELVAIGTHYTAIGCPMISAYFSEVNAILAATGKSLTAVAL